MNILSKIILSLCVVASANAATMFIIEEADLDTAKVYAGNPFKQNGDKLEYTGFMKDNTVYATKNLSLKIADVKDQSAVKKLEGNKVLLTVKVDSEKISNDQFDAWDDKEEIFLEKCSQCHAAPDVPGHTMLEWEGLYGSMKGFAQPTAEEEKAILSYLKTFAKDGILKEEE